MLKLFRKKNVAKMILWGILILILPAFVIWGSGGLGRSKERGPTYVGLINNKKVSFDEFAQSLGSIKCHIILNYFNQPKMLGSFLNNKSFMGKLAWDRLIMAKEAKRYKIKVPDQDVINYIRSHPLFSRNGGFDDRIYEYVLRNNLGLDPRSFEEVVRENLALRKLNDLLAKDIKATDADVLEGYREDNEKFKISYVMFSQDASLAEEKHKKIKEFMQKDKDSFEAACAKLKLKTQETVLFSKTDYVEGIGEAASLVNIAVRLKQDEISDLIQTRKGILMFRVSEMHGFDEEKFKKEKVDYSKKALENKKNKFLENWLKNLELATSLNIDLNNYDKYYR